MTDVPATEAAYLRAKQAGEAERERSPLPISVRFDEMSERIIVEFSNGAFLMVPARLLQGLQEATAEQLSEVQLLGETGLHWENLDVDYTVAGLMSGIFGTKSFMDAQRIGGQSRSLAKRAASRANGAKGGRPRKSGA